VLAAVVDVMADRPLWAHLHDAGLRDDIIPQRVRHDGGLGVSDPLIASNPSNLV